MGTRMAPSYANIFMAALGKQMLLQSLHNLQPLTWLRIIDDIFMLWTHGPKPLLTSFNPSTHFIPQSKSATNNPTPPSTSWTPPSNSRNNEHCSPHYTKPTDKGLLFHSSHHRQALPYGRIITNNHELHKHLRRLHKILLARGYSHSTITTAFNKVTSHTQSQLLQPKTPPVTNGIHLPFIIPTTPVFRLKDMLVHSRFSTHNCKTKFSTATNLNTTSIQHNTTQHNTTQHNTTQHNTQHQPHQLIPKQSNTRANPHAVKEQKAIYLHKPSYPQQEPESLRPQNNHNHKDQ